MNTAVDVGHITLQEESGKADCSVCGTGITTPESFGSIPRSRMLTAFVVQHSTHTKAGVASGLTPSGRPSKSARRFLASGGTQ